jgi:hypothetical protein
MLARFVLPALLAFGAIACAEVQPHRVAHGQRDKFATPRATPSVTAASAERILQAPSKPSAAEICKLALDGPVPETPLEPGSFDSRSVAAYVDGTLRNDEFPFDWKSEDPEKAKLLICGRTSRSNAGTYVDRFGKSAMPATKTTLEVVAVIWPKVVAGHRTVGGPPLTLRMAPPGAGYPSTPGGVAIGESPHGNVSFQEVLNWLADGAANTRRIGCPLAVVALAADGGIALSDGCHNTIGYVPPDIQSPLSKRASVDLSFRGLRAPAVAMAFTHAGSRFLALHEFHQMGDFSSSLVWVSSWSTTSGEEHRHELTGPWRAARAAFDAANERVAVFTNEHFEIVKPSTGEARSMVGGAHAVAFSPTGARMARLQECELSLWDVDGRSTSCWDVSSLRAEKPPALPKSGKLGPCGPSSRYAGSCPSFKISFVDESRMTLVDAQASHTGTISFVDATDARIIDRYTRPGIDGRPRFARIIGVSPDGRLEALLENINPRMFVGTLASQDMPTSVMLWRASASQTVVNFGATSLYVLIDGVLAEWNYGPSRQ